MPGKTMYAQNVIYRAALEWIAEHFSGCDIDNDESATRVVKKACEALGWTMSKDSSNQLVLIKSKICSICKRTMTDAECGAEFAAERVCDTCAAGVQGKLRSSKFFPSGARLVTLDEGWAIQLCEQCHNEDAQTIFRGQALCANCYEKSYHDNAQAT